jgi:hypothetical protein
VWQRPCGETARVGESLATFRVTYFDNSGPSGTTGLCAMTYVFDRSEELTEYWGCSGSTDGLCILSVARDLTGQPLTGIKTKSPIWFVVGADAASNPSCGAWAPTTTGEIKGWATHAQNLGTAGPHDPE